ncbi:GNAT family N-acetyltransferase [Variovorax rhizosphaerae]|uniref:GNAT family N-acetyltransferase n=1 Tax=Variovorax rhizosphaerae TaxID=1836200 RepID=A0ABU8WVT3_9BURK
MGPVLPARLQLRDGRSVWVREIEPEDKDGLQAAVGNMSVQSRYMRFMATVKAISEPMLEKATHPVPDREFALVAVNDEGGAESIVAGARYASDAGSDTCEFAIMVVDDWQGQGLAPRLMETLMEAAEAHGFHVMEGSVLTANASMRGLARRLGFEDKADPRDATVRVVSRVLGSGRATAGG